MSMKPIILELHEMRERLKAASIRDIPLYVTYYARVSTDSDDQLNSLENQVSHYHDLIHRNPNWILVEGYIDEGLSGASVCKREAFQRMITDAEDGKFNLILTKEISRFARNTLDSIHYTRKLLSSGVGVLFENDNINTFDGDSELRLTIMASIAQDELRRLSSRITFGHQRAIKEGKVLGCSRLYGYDYVNKRLRINDKEAKVLRELYKLYATNEYSSKQIAQIFWDKGYRSRSDTRIASSVLCKLISNPRYKGYYVAGKTKSVDIFSRIDGKRNKAIPQEEWVMYRDESGEVSPAIVSEELWEKANAVLRRRSQAVKRKTGTYNHANLMTGKLLCTHCGTTYHNRKDKSGERWICSSKITKGASSCPSFRIKESELVEVLLATFHETIFPTEDVTQRYVKMYQSLDRDQGFSKDIAKLKKRIEFETKKKHKLLDHNTKGVLSDEDFASMMANCQNAIATAQSALFELEEQLGSKQEFEKHIESLREKLQEIKHDVKSGSITRGFVEKYIDTIYATPISKDCLRIEVKLFTGETTEKYLSKVRERFIETAHVRLETNTSLFMPLFSASRCTPWAL